MTIKNVEVAIIDKAWESGFVRPQPPEWLSGRTVAVDRLRARPASPPPSSSPAPATPSRSTSAPTRSAGCCATASPSSRWRRSTSTGASTRCAARAPSSAPASTSAATSPAEQLRDRYDAVVLAMGATDAARPAGPRPRARRHPPGDGVPAAGQPGLARRGGRGPDHAPTASTSSSSAAATPAPTASAPPPARAPASITQLEILPEPPEDASRRPAVADVPDDLPGLLGPRGGRRAGLRRSRPRSSSATTTATCRALRLVEVVVRGRQARRRSRAPSARSRPSWCCSRWASPGREQDGPGRAARRRPRRARQRRPRPALPRLGRRRLRRRRRRPRPVADRLGHRRGPGRGRRRRRVPHRLDHPAVADPARPSAPSSSSG